MKVCIIGDGLVSLTLANVLIKKELKVDILANKNRIKYDKSRTLGISKSNIDFFNKEIININKIAWKINNIKIYTEKNFREEILKFNNENEQIFSIIKNHELSKLLIDELKKSKYIKFKVINDYNNIINEKYNLIINCNPNHYLQKNFFIINYKKIIIAMPTRL